MSGRVVKKLGIKIDVYLACFTAVGMLVAEFVHTELLLADKKLLVTSSYNTVIIQALHQTCQNRSQLQHIINTLTA